MAILARRFGEAEGYYSTPYFFSNLADERMYFLVLDGTGDDFVISVPRDYNGTQFFLRMNPHTGVADHRGLTEDRAQATHFEAVETLFRGQREYYTLPDFFYFRLKATPPSFLKVHWREQIGVVPQACVTQHRRARYTSLGARFCSWNKTLHTLISSLKFFSRRIEKKGEGGREGGSGGVDGHDDHRVFACVVRGEPGGPPASSPCLRSPDGGAA